MVSGTGEYKGLWLTETKEDLPADDASMVSRVATAAETNENSECNGEETGADDDERLEMSDEANGHSDKDSRNDGHKTVERCDARGASDGLADGDDQNSIQVVTLAVPC